MKLLACEPINDNGVQMTWEVYVEGEGATKPVCISKSLACHYP
jgi:hypothetical protein